MPTLRLFAQLRELAGASRVEIDGDDVGAVLTEACRRFGPAFEAAARRAAVWVDGEPLDPASTPALGPASEVALVPPVSGGAS